MLRHRRFPGFIYVLIGLAMFGLINQLLTNTANFFTNIVITVGIATSLYLVFRFVFMRQRVNDDLKKYRKAAKQSKKRFKSNGKSNYSQIKKKNKPVRKKRLTDKSVPHLRLIEGKKPH